MAGESRKVWKDLMELERSKDEARQHNMNTSLPGTLERYQSGRMIQSNPYAPVVLFVNIPCVRQEPQSRTSSPKVLQEC